MCIFPSVQQRPSPSSSSSPLAHSFILILLTTSSIVPSLPTSLPHPTTPPVFPFPSSICSSNDAPVFTFPSSISAAAAAAAAPSRPPSTSGSSSGSTPQPLFSIFIFFPTSIAATFPSRHPLLSSSPSATVTHHQSAAAAAATTLPMLVAPLGSTLISCVAIFHCLQPTLFFSSPFKQWQRVEED